MMILITILLGFCQALTGSMSASRSQRETAIATGAAREIISQLQAADFETLFADNNSSTLDDAGAGMVRLAAFDVPGLNVRAGDPDGLCGQILLPEVTAAGVSQLREDLNEPTLGMPRDLNGDGVADANDHSGDYLILPVIVRVDWRGARTNGRVQFRTILSDF